MNLLFKCNKTDKLTMNKVGDIIFLRNTNKKNNMQREELKSKIDELMRQYAEGEIDGPTYATLMMELTSSFKNDDDEDDDED